MAKNVFSPVEIVDLTAQKIKVEVTDYSPSEPEVKDVYEGPTADELRREAELFRENWEEEKNFLMEDAREKADKIVKEAENRAFEEMRAKTEAVIEDKKEAEDLVVEMKESAEREAQVIREKAISEKNQVFEEAREEGIKQGREEGWKEGVVEAERVRDRLHKVLDAAIRKRSEIIEETETQIIDLVLLITTKVVKVISESQKNVLVNNTVQALQKLKNRGQVSIRINLADMEEAKGHVKDFISMVENVENITVLEDSSVDKGGVIVETDFGEIDARISSQLREIERAIVELVPIRNTGAI